MYRRLAVAGAFLSGACATGNAPVSSTTSAHGGAEVAPADQARASEESTREAPLAGGDPRERVVFVNGGALFVLDPVAGVTRRLTTRGAADDEAPALSPNGTAIVFASADGGAAKLWLVASEGGEVKPLTDGAGGGDGAPAWSPDGRELVFTRGRDQMQLMIFSFDGGAPRQLLAGKDVAAGFAGTPAWSPDGAWIVFAADREEGEGTGLWLIAPDGAGLRRLTRPERRVAWARDLSPAWSPDGQKIVFARHVGPAEDQPDYDLFVVDVASGALTRLTDDPGSASDPSWSADGERIYFVSTRELPRDYERELYVMPAAGGEQRRLTRVESPRHAAPSAGRAK